jgi:MFS family permease
MKMPSLERLAFHPRLMIRLLLLSEILWAVGEGLFFYLLPVYVQELGATPAQVGLAFGVGELALTLTYLPVGWLADRTRRKPLMLGGWFAGLIGILLMAGATTWWTMLPGLTLYFMSGYCLPVIHAYVARMAGPIPPEQSFPLLSAGYAAGGLLTPALGGWLAQRAGMRSVLLLSAGLFALSTVAALLLPPDPPPDLHGQGRRSGSSGSWRQIPWRFGLALLTLFTVGQVGLILLPNFLQQAGGWAKSHLGLFASLQALGTIVLGPALGRWDQDRARPLGLATAWGLAGIGMGLLLVGFRSFFFVGAAMVLVGGAYAAYSLAAARILRLTPSETQATAAALVHTASSMAAALAAPLAGLLFSFHPARPLQVAGLILPLALFGILWTGRSVQTPAHAEAPRAP